MSTPQSPQSQPPPQPQAPSLPQPQPHSRERPTFLGVMLILWVIFSAMSACNYLRSLTGLGIAYTPLRHPDWTFPYIGFLSLVDLVCVIAIWNWKRWGMYGLAVSAAVMFIITLISLNVVNAVISICGVIIIGLLVRKVWGQMN
jgi:hypothetical protein